MAIISLLVSIIALMISGAAYFLARKTGLLQQRREAIDHVRSAYSDVTIHGQIDAKTTNSVREAYQLSKLVFSKKVFKELEKLHGMAFQLEHTRSERKTEKDWDDQQTMGKELQRLLEQMQAEAAINRWP